MKRRGNMIGKVLLVRPSHTDLGGHKQANKVQANDITGSCECIVS